MTSYVTLLRAVNVGGIKLPMAQLRASLASLGLRNVRTYLQSGNAVFDAREDEPTQALATAIEARIDRDFGVRVGVLVLPGESMGDVAVANPFLNDAAESGATVDGSILHATFLFGRHGEAHSSDASQDFGETTQAAYCAVFRAAFAKLELPAAEGEEAAFVGAPPLATPVVYLKLPYGYGRSKLGNALFERKLGTAATTRNWRTVLALAAMAGDGD